MCLFKAPEPPKPPEPKPADEIHDEAIRARGAGAIAAREATQLTPPLGLPQTASTPPATKRLLGA